MISLNIQPPEKPKVDAFGCLEVHSIFYTIQGEGPFAGRSAVFVRLAGCNLQCPQCDTDYTSVRERHNVEYILYKIDEIKDQARVHRSKVHEFDNRPLVVVTGGEPFRQDIVPLLNAISMNHWDVQVETNGTLFPVNAGQLVLPFLTIVCSPKTPLINDRIKPYIHSLKYVLDAGYVSDADGLPTTTLGTGIGVARPWPNFQGKIYVSPADTGDLRQNEDNVQAAVKSCMKYGYTLSIQSHKILGLP